MIQLNDKEYDYLVKVLLIGEPGVGKSTFCSKLNSGDFIDSYSSTIGVDFFCIYTDIDSRVYKLQIWDTAGQERFRSITRSYYRNAKIILLIFDLNDFNINSIKKWLNEIENFCSNDYKIILIGNKLDLSKNIDSILLEDLIKEHNLSYLELSVKNNDNFKNFFELLHLTINNLPKDYFTIKRDNLNLLVPKKKKISFCNIL